MARSLLFLSFLLLFACNNLEDANVPDRQTFIRFFGSPRSYVAVAAEPDLDGGFIMVGNAEPLETDDATDQQKRPGIIIVKTNNQGTKLWEKLIDNANVRSIKPLADGYLLSGAGIELNPNSTESSEFVNSSFLLLKLSPSGEIVQQYRKDSSVVALRGEQQVTLKVDFKANAAVVTAANEVVALGSFKVPVTGQQERVFTIGFSAANVAAPVWRRNLDLFNFDYVNTNQLGSVGGNLVWASTATPADVNQAKYVSVIAVPPNFASPLNNSLFGKNEEGSHEVNDFRPAATGFGLVGTYTNKSTGNTNVFFAKVDQVGNVVASSARYFDCASIDNDPPLVIQKTDQGTSQDAGTAIAYTNDGGFVLACSMGPTPERGNGGTDIVLIKIDAFGNYKWNKLLGGSGNEVANSISELADGTLLISGTSTISNVSSMFIIRSDRNGNLNE